MFTTLDLENFLKKHKEEWWTPSEIGQKLGVDLRTVKNAIRKLDNLPHKGWRLEIAERGKRLYVVRMVRDIDSSRKRIRIPIVSKEQQTLFDYPRERAHMADTRAPM